MKKLLALPSLVATITVSLTVWAASVWTPYGSIDRLEEYGSGIRVYGLDVSANPAGCSTTSYARLDTSISDADQDKIAKIIIAGFLSGRDVSIKLRDSGCVSNVPSIYAARIR